MAFKIDFDIAPDGASIRLDCQTRRMRLTAEELDRVIQALVLNRSLMVPAHDELAPPAEVPVETANMRWWVGAHPRPGHVRIALRHPGHGWVAAALTLAQSERMERELGENRAAAVPLGFGRVGDIVPP